jgi:NAD(P)H-hydrate epimerase
VNDDWAVVSVAEMRALEAAATAQGVSEEALQRRAAGEIAIVSARFAPDTTRVVVLIGPGNNGRDAFLAGRLLAGRGRRVFYYLGPRHAIQANELAALRSPHERVVQHRDDGPNDLTELRAELARASVALDGLLGIGLRGPLRSPLAEIAATLNESSANGSPWVVAVDVPSGIDADTGAVEGAAVRADLTIALGAVKAGLLRFPAAALVGRLVVHPIGLPGGTEQAAQVRLLDAAMARSLLPARPLDAHKGTLGWVLVIGGAREYIGAPVLSGSAAAYSGCGLVALAVPPQAQVAAATALPEATFLLRDAATGGEQAAVLADRLSSFEALVLGPGLGRDDESLTLVRELLQRLAALEHPPKVVIDADALYVLANWPDWWRQIPAGCVLTPHHGEMARLIGQDVATVVPSTWELAVQRAVEWGQVVVLKGAHTVVADPAASARVYPRANPALATAGSGDVLAGLIGGLAAQGLAPREAAQLAVVVHALAAERALSVSERRSLVASDLLTQLSAVLRELGLARRVSDSVDTGTATRRL